LPVHNFQTKTQNAILSKRQSIITILFAVLISFNCYSQNTYVFVGSYNFNKHKKGIYVFKLDTITGQLKKITTVKNVLNPSYLTVSPDGNYIYACTDTKTPMQEVSAVLNSNHKIKL